MLHDRCDSGPSQTYFLSESVSYTSAADSHPAAFYATRCSGYHPAEGIGVDQMTGKNGKQLYVERREEGDYAVRRGGSERASAVEPTQREAIARAKVIEPQSTPMAERVRKTTGGHPEVSIALRRSSARSRMPTKTTGPAIRKGAYRTTPRSAFLRRPRTTA
jgi:hypothetical protein